MENHNIYIESYAPSILICTQALARQNFACFLCDVSVFPSTALYRCVIPRTDRYWARVYGDTGANLAFQRNKKWRAFCKKCAPADAVLKQCAPSVSEMRSRGNGEVPSSVTNWLIRNRFSYKSNWNRKCVEAYGNFLKQNQIDSNEPNVLYNNFKEEMARLFSHNAK